MFTMIKYFFRLLTLQLLYIFLTIEMVLGETDTISQCEFVFNQVEKWVNEFAPRETEIRGNLGSIEGPDLESITKFLDDGKNYVETHAQNIVFDFKTHMELSCGEHFRTLWLTKQKLKNIYKKMDKITDREEAAGYQTEKYIIKIGEIINKCVLLYTQIEDLLNSHPDIKEKVSITAKVNQIKTIINNQLGASYKIYSGNPAKYRNNLLSIKRLFSQAIAQLDILNDIIIKIDPASAIADCLVKISRKLNTFAHKAEDLRVLTTNLFRNRKKTQLKLFVKIEIFHQQAKAVHEIFDQYNGKSIKPTKEGVEVLHQALKTIDKYLKGLENLEKKVKKAEHIKTYPKMKNTKISNVRNRRETRFQTSGTKSQSQLLHDLDILNNECSTAFHKVRRLVARSGINYKNQRQQEMFNSLLQVQHELNRYKGKQDISSRDLHSITRTIIFALELKTEITNFVEKFKEFLNQNGMPYRYSKKRIRNVEDSDNDEMNGDTSAADEQLTGGAIAAIVISFVLINTLVIAIPTACILSRNIATDREKSKHNKIKKKKKLKYHNEYKRRMNHSYDKVKRWAEMHDFTQL